MAVGKLGEKQLELSEEKQQRVYSESSFPYAYYSSCDSSFLLLKVKGQGNGDIWLGEGTCDRREQVFGGMGGECLSSTHAMPWDLISRGFIIIPNKLKKTILPLSPVCWSYELATQDFRLGLGLGYIYLLKKKFLL